MERLKRIRISAKAFNWLGLLIALFGTYLVWPIYFEAMIYPLQPDADLWKSLDPSWILQLNYASMHHYVWGTDIAFTYGPLAFLSTKVGWGQHRWSFLLYDIFVAINFFFVFFLSFKDSKNKITTTLLIVCFWIVCPVWLGSANALVLMAFLIFWIFKSLDNPRIIFYVLQAVLVVLAFFIKFNTGLISFPLFFLGLSYNVIKAYKDKKLLLLLISAAILPFVLIAIVAIPLNVAIFAYARAGVEMVVGYNDVMFMGHEWKNRRLALIIIALALAIFIFKIAKGGKQQLLRNLTAAVLFGAGIFTLYKQAFVRGMEIDFFIFSSLIILVSSDIFDARYRRFFTPLIIGCLGISLYFVLGYQKVPLQIGKKLDKMYVSQYKAFTSKSGMHIFPNNNQLPLSVKNKIGNATVDVYPWNFQMLLENKLNCVMRPSCQSYSTYTPYLVEMNFEFYNSSKAPEFVIYDSASVDYRYPLFDDPKLNLVFLRNYQVAEVFDFENRKVLLLQKKANFHPVKLEKSNEYAIYIDTPLSVRPGIYYTVEPYYSVSGRIKSVLDHSADIQLDIMKKNGEVRSYKTSSKLLQSGVFCDYYISSTMDFMSLMTGNPVNGLEKISQYKFRPLDRSYFDKKIKVTEYKIE
jgi:hypothetical protein